MKTRACVKRAPAQLEKLAKETVSSPYRLVLHYADGRGRAEDRGVVVFVRYEDPRGDRTPAPLRGICGLVRGPHHQEERRRGLAIQLLTQSQNAADGIQGEEVMCFRPVVLDGVN